ncbi:hypothetical protein SARC_04536 [Sphaeroforma arctica JP610]|uniref:sphingomyelin phosphodiesterase n=1 Tax=Sphaeroforma arctica JP610 TaxID=667725 RepID=A0A0L0G307_9EUKA|nr:hypothetical protein SARC_04536 [Sphaeroforma arctica JP610]KNC83211.1 hypothetical protein SARC_04536 [Sphaeroforma arctica JP610]|eukprot:XP_014157113.1 hypothetical protein SARC_04536 [Sphaeroforma arctica JP610]
MNTWIIVGCVLLAFLYQLWLNHVDYQNNARMVQYIPVNAIQESDLQQSYYAVATAEATHGIGANGNVISEDARRDLDKADAYNVEAASSRKKTLRFLTYNIFIRPPGIQSAGTDYKDLRLQLLPSVLAEYDVICLQELFGTGSDRRNRLLSDLAKHGLGYSVFLPYQLGYFPPKLIDGGVTIVSRYPIEFSDFFVYSDAYLFTADVWTSKGILLARVQVPQADGNPLSVDVYSTHMQAHDAEDDRYTSVRYKQIKEMLAFVKRHSGTENHIVIAGDFNVNGRVSRSDDRDGPEYLSMMSLFGSDSADGREWIDVLRRANDGRQIITGGDEYNVPKFGASKPKPVSCSKRLDYIMTSQGTEGKFSAVNIAVQPFEYNDRDDISRLSDHLALSAKLQWD